MHVTIALPDPSASTWDERYALRVQAADDHREASGTTEDVGVDVVVSGDLPVSTGPVPAARGTGTSR